MSAAPWGNETERADYWLSEWKTEHAENKRLTAKLNALEVDAEPVVRGEWVLLGENEHDYETLLEEKCSLCGRYVYRYDTQPQDNYCPNCGAKMEVEP